MQMIDHIERGTQAVIKTANITHNLVQFKKLHPANIIAVVKADAYGHGLTRVVPFLQACDAFAVATIEEALELRTIDPDKRIILLEGVFNSTEMQTAITHRFDVVVHQAYQLELLAQLESLNQIDVWLKFDTGMNRLGFSLEKAEQVLSRLKASSGVNTIRLMTHFASSDEKDSKQTQEQLTLNQWVKSKNMEYSLSNTAAVLNGLSDDSEWVRVGIGLYGISPLPDHSAADFDLKPVMQLQANIIAIKTAVKGSLIGYAGTYQAQRDMKLGVVGIGYADGYPWTAQQSHVMIEGKKAPIVGRVSMDMLTIDLTDIQEVTIGSTVVMWGENWPAENVSQELGVIPYTLCCGITKRVKFYDVQ